MSITLAEGAARTEVEPSFPCVDAGKFLSCTDAGRLYSGADGANLGTDWALLD